MAKSHFLVFGEDDNDRRSVAALVKALAPDAKVEVRARPMILARNAERSGKRRSMADDIAALVRFAKTKDNYVTAVVHQDCDALEPQHIAEATALKATLTQASIKTSACATPAWEIETWWMLFPNSVNNARGCWRQVDYSRANVGSISNAKERLIRDLRPTSKPAQNRCKDYVESDSIKIAEHIRQNGALTLQMRAKCASLDAFCSEVEAASAVAAAA